MGSSRKVRAVVIILMVWVVGVSAAGTGWAQPAVPEASASGADRSATQILAAVAAAVGSLFYIPFKAAAICPGMALASGASLAVSRGNRDTADYLLRVGCTGTYIITPEMIRGQEEFQGSGSSDSETSMPMTGPR